VIELLTKHHIIEMAIDATFNGIARNFSTASDILKPGMRFTYLEFTDNISSDYGDATYIYYNVTIIAVTIRVISFEYQRHRESRLHNDIQSAQDDFNAYRRFYNDNTTKYEVLCDEPDKFVCVDDDCYVSMGVWKSTPQYRMELLLQYITHDTTNIPMSIYQLKGYELA
jgi:hypothetical protein